MPKIVNCKLQIANCKLPATHPLSGHRPKVGRESVRVRAEVLLAAAAMILLLFAAGCGQKSENSRASLKEEKNPARSVVERGPVKLTAEVQPAKARLSDEPVLTLTIDYEQGVQIEKPPFGSSLGSFLVRDFRQPLTKTRNGREILQQIYTLEPMRPAAC